MVLGPQRRAERPRPVQRDLSQRTLSEARHDRINPSKNTRRHSALSVHAWVPDAACGQPPSSASVVSFEPAYRSGNLPGFSFRPLEPLRATGVLLLGRPRQRRMMLNMSLAKVAMELGLTFQQIQ